VWRLDPDLQLAPLTDEGVYGTAAVSPDGRRLALIADGQLRVLEVGRPAAARVVPGAFGDARVCGWPASGDAVFVRSTSLPIAISRVDLATAATTALFEIDPPRLGRRGVDALIVSQTGDAYAYSYGQELSRLYTMTTEDPDA